MAMRAAVLLLLAVAGRAGAALTTSEPYDCQAGFSNWQTEWSISKQQWCCEKAEVGCKPAEHEITEDYDCDSAIGNFEAAWPAKKKAWCCKREQKGCSAQIVLRLCRGIWDDFSWSMDSKHTEQQEHKECCVIVGKEGCCHTKLVGDLCFNERSRMFNASHSDNYGGFRLLLQDSGHGRWHGSFADSKNHSQASYWENVSATQVEHNGEETNRALLVGDDMQKHAGWYQLCHFNTVTKKRECCNAGTKSSTACCNTKDGHRLCWREDERIMHVTGDSRPSYYEITLVDQGCGNFTGQFAGDSFEAQVQALASTFVSCSGEAQGATSWADPLHCLRWQAVGGCDSITDERQCLGSRDGRPARQWKGHAVAGQPCAWCGGTPCTLGSTARCMPADWVKGRPNVTVANCSEGRPMSEEPELLLLNRAGREFANGHKMSSCRSSSGGHRDTYEPYFTFTAKSLNQCKLYCTAYEFCTGVDFRYQIGRPGVCQVWWHTIESLRAAPDHECVKIKNASDAPDITLAPTLWELFDFADGWEQFALGGPVGAQHSSASTQPAGKPSQPSVVPMGGPWDAQVAITHTSKTTTTVTATTTTTTTTSTVITRRKATTRRATTRMATTNRTLRTTTHTTPTRTNVSLRRHPDAATEESPHRGLALSPASTTRDADSPNSSSLSEDGTGDLPDMLMAPPADTSSSDGTMSPSSAESASDAVDESHGAAVRPELGLTFDNSGETAFEEAPEEEEVKVEAEPSSDALSQGDQQTASSGLSEGEQAAIGVSAGVAGAALIGGLLGGLLKPTGTTTTPVVVVSDALAGSGAETPPITQTATWTSTFADEWTTTSSIQRALLLGAAQAAESGAQAPRWFLVVGVGTAVVTGLCCIAYAYGAGSLMGTSLWDEEEEDEESGAEPSEVKENALPKECTVRWPTAPSARSPRVHPSGAAELVPASLVNNPSARLVSAASIASSFSAVAAPQPSAQQSLLSQSPSRVRPLSHMRVSTSGTSQTPRPLSPMRGVPTPRGSLTSRPLSPMRGVPTPRGTLTPMSVTPTPSPRTSVGGAQRSPQQPLAVVRASISPESRPPSEPVSPRSSHNAPAAYATITPRNYYQSGP